MSDKNMIIKPVAAAVGVAFISSVAFSTTAVAADNPFAAADLDSGYLLAGGDGEEGKCGEGKCGDDKGDDGKCGEGKCGEGKCGDDKGEEGSCGEDKGDEGKCGEGKCGGSV
ncbi:HvfA family oxazolone/thioamide-modified RiPP metallophore [Elongatibacter sediminis]|uniref:Low-complexity protein n=1 Tax=Elongatibacter sediminis TaxID=3119006 RepID=A0AAW9R668_9GAMM